MEKRTSDIIDKIADYYRDEKYILLESQMPDHPSSEVSYIAIRPKSEIFGYGSVITKRSGDTEQAIDDNPWQAIRTYHDESEGTVFGYFGYELKNYIESLESKNISLLEVPDFYFMEPEILIQVKGGEASLVRGEADLKRLQDHEPARPTGSISEIKLLERKSTYIRKVRKIQQKIREGDFYELNYSYPMEASITGNPFWLYQKSREINPVPFGAYIQAGDFQVCCASPERFLKKSGSKIISEPIKGTAPRSDDPATDQQYKEELLNEKNKAENLMIVDLVRHDLSMIAETGSVRVLKLFDIQTFGTVHQLISSVEARTLDYVHPVDVIKACFPMGSMTGAPKIEVMKTIEDLEIYRRGIYSGAIGYITPDGDFDFNVVIRSAMIKKGKLIYPVGGAITGDSDPEAEWEETHIKARTMSQIAKK
ncbi:anthranilate synthase component I family protein [Rhodohalobacter barkolensis]|uniref:Aminodeoxychorismate synthase n=1 Tax=Rhodohalobacter barkolensis TaxID=2053187 RepID=A0A2N0VFM2_9BACT|nr:anthranilate synthase component I family protein [Rhodohalobacter barkolensis]PKD42991.1 hypothetical protein CWD77_10160 [Rhodohalobacter barkolensis]